MLNKNDFRLMCANERLYEAYSELHCLAQGECRATGRVKTASCAGCQQQLPRKQPNQHELLGGLQTSQEEACIQQRSLSCPRDCCASWSEPAPCLALQQQQQQKWLAIVSHLNACFAHPPCRL
jgi:hypothetical protein